MEVRTEVELVKVRVIQYVDGKAISDALYEPEQNGEVSRVVARVEYCGQGPGMSRNAQYPTWIETVVYIMDRKES